MYSYDDGAAYTLLRPYLQDGEEVLWCGKPYTSVPYRPNPAILLFSIFWLGFAVFWTVTASVAGGAFGLFGLPFVGVGCFLLYNAFFGQVKQMKRTTYAVTDRRAIILTERRGGVDCTEFPFANMGRVSLVSVRGEVGTILFPVAVFAAPYVSSRRGATMHMSQQQPLNHAFLMIDNVHTVYRLISEQITANG